MDDRDNIPEWDDRKTLSSIFQSHHALPISELSDQFYSALLAVAQAGYQHRLDAEAADTDAQSIQAMLRLARADAYRQGIKDGRAAAFEELGAIVDEADQVRAVLAARKAARDGN